MHNTTFKVSEKEIKFPIVISAFPGVGKTYFYNYMRDVERPGYVPDIKDSDSSKFPKQGFPLNYVQAIKKDLNHFDIQLVSSHIEVRQRLAVRNIDYYLVFPHCDLKEAYLSRYERRGSPQAFIDLLDNNWENWIRSCEDDQHAIKRCVLHHPDAYLKSLTTKGSIFDFF